ncbi:hypothetical protein DQT32_03600 [Salmonella enterica subsp. enterica serovar Braenderup]|nr:hypothetical protein [Salmonella enterica subsp. enterica serovar Braenderup]
MAISFSEEVFKALNDIYEKYTKNNGKPTEFLSWSHLEDQDITDGGFELHPRSETDTDPSAHHICLYLDDGTLYIDPVNLIFFYDGGRRINLMDYMNVTEEQHFQQGTVNMLYGAFSMDELKELNEWLHKIL